MQSITPENPVKRGRHEINIDHIRTYASAIRPVSDWEKEKYREALLATPDKEVFYVRYGVTL